MAYGDYSGPDKADKGKEGGSCNRGRCQAAPALWYNHGSYAWYCLDCARDIGHANRHTFHLDMPHCYHPMFETRDQMDARKNPPPAPREGKAMTLWLLTEKIDGITFRVKQSSNVPWPFYAEAIRGDFTTDNSLYEPPSVDVWFEFGMSADEVLGKLKAELFHQKRAVSLSHYWNRGDTCVRCGARATKTATIGPCSGPRADLDIHDDRCASRKGHPCNCASAAFTPAPRDPS